MLRPRFQHVLLIAAALAPPTIAQAGDAPLEVPSRVTFQRAELRKPGKDVPRVIQLARLAAEGRRPLRLAWAREGERTNDPFADLTLDVRGTPAMLPLYVAEPEKWTRMTESLLAASNCPCAAWGAIPGRVPDGKVFRGQPLRLAKSGADVLLTWGPSCSDAVKDYSVQRGTIGSWYSHQAVDCMTGGVTSTTLAPGAGSAYFLVVPITDDLEGSYGVRSNGQERPGGLVTCRPMWTTQQCQDIP